MTDKNNQTDSSATNDDLTAAHAKIYRDAIALVCEGWNLPNDARKVLETALWAQPEAPASEQAQQDAVKFGASITRTHADGSIERIDPFSIYKEPAATTASTSGELGPSVPDHIITAIRTYGDFRADDDPSASAQLGEVIYALRRHYRTAAHNREATPLDERALAKGDGNG